MATVSPAVEPRLTEGARVEASDGGVLGMLSELAETHFRVSASGERDYWLSRALVQHAEPEYVVLTLDSEQVEDFKTASPEVLSESPDLDAQGDTFASEAERAERRQAMERGYEAPGASARKVRDEAVFENEPAYRQPGGAGSGAPD